MPNQPDSPSDDNRTWYYGFILKDRHLDWQIKTGPALQSGLKGLGLQDTQFLTKHILGSLRQEKQVDAGAETVTHVCRKPNGDLVAKTVGIIYIRKVHGGMTNEERDRKASVLNNSKAVNCLREVLGIRKEKPAQWFEKRGEHVEECREDSSGDEQWDFGGWDDETEEGQV